MFEWATKGKTFWLICISLSYWACPFNFHSFIHSHPNTAYFSLPSAALLSFFYSFSSSSWLDRSFWKPSSLALASQGLPRSRFFIKFRVRSISWWCISFFTFLIDFAENFQRYPVDLGLSPSRAYNIQVLSFEWYRLLIIIFSGSGRE